ncbi:NADH-quinone oxidoreductase subunit J [Geobacter sulfurreducens]|uniref:NADH-quinone oxidoreductase subunit J n=1 Tax=Geobacter sulfurreducens (strain ATCC 51573 / DSM 12127 / PCA) TaxID=243231 RepID=Q74G99_GEOSL|nr:NADH-quinone oxidoreductase subunit J [Geobacter sulfurreducens]AAR33680.1 NADH dehydrogenase I, J subunit [Geobacter sulfurreducens PCA]ADI83178.1 NADH dehydrogenase I, J subunit [Geobacter sulfurreducens KN400]AJY70072.1 NADH dehydrogenase [Geobacter sulfurreducens]QVW35607.1 NADH-quinone oxidoreductase subunit J [Geobacter sulfurreducens]UAC04430.1 NADH-quinone oxidoreductase subunit J [Geobacter sulfurreducens]
METFFFTIVAAVAVLASILVITCKNPINSALSLILTFFCLATFYVMLDAPFMAAIQVIVYAGAIMVLIVFVIMLLNVRTEAGRRSSHTVLLGSLVGIFTLVQLFYVLNRSSLTGNKGEISPELIHRIGHTEIIGKALYTDFLLPFEVTSILLLVAIIGAVILTKKKI